MTADPQSVTVKILGRTLTVCGHDDDLTRWLAHHWYQPRHEVPTHPFAIVVDCAPEPSLAPDLQALLPEGNASPVDAATPRFQSGDGDGVLLGSRAGGAYLQLDPEGASVQAWGVTGPETAGRWPLLVAVHEAVRASGLLPLHCAAAVRPGEEGASAFLGPSGVGKSTTLLALAQAGWEPVCEDFAWLDPTSLRLFAWDYGVRLLPDAVERLGPLPTREPSGVVADKHVVTYREILDRYGVRRRHSAPLKRLAWLVRGDGLSSWEPLSRLEAVPVLWEAIGLPLTSTARRQVAEQIATLVASVELRRLRLGQVSVVEMLKGTP